MVNFTLHLQHRVAAVQMHFKQHLVSWGQLKVAFVVSSCHKKLPFLAMPYKHRQHVSFSFVEAKLFEVLPVKRIAIDQVSMDRVSRLERLYHCVQLLQHQENLAHLTATTPTIS